MKKKMYYGWWVVVGVSLTLFVCSGIGFATLPVFLKFIETDMGWSRGSISNAGALAALAAGLTAPFFGFAFDRFSARAIMLPGAALLGASYFLLGRVGSVSQFYCLYVVTGIGMAATTILPSQTLVSRWFKQERGRAMGIITSAAGLGSMVWVPVSSYLIESHGWRNSYRILGVSIAAVSLPFIWLTIRNSPQSMGLEMDGRPNPSPKTAAPNTDIDIQDDIEFDYSVRRAFRTASYWLIFFAIFVVAVASSGFGLHVVAFLSDSGLTAGGAATAWSVTIGFSIGGRFLFGYLSERHQKRYFAAGANFARALSLFLLVLLALELMPVLAASMMLIGVYGLALGCNNVLNPLIVAETFGVKAFGSLMGSFGIPFTIGMALGQFAAGRLYEAYNNYIIAFSAFVIAFVLAGIAITFAKPYFLMTAQAKR